jgi:acetylglutamate kinase
MVLVGKINDGIVSLIARGGARGVGLSGNDGNLMIARKMDPQKVKEGGRVREVDLGYVGEIETVDPAVLLTLLDKGYIPVIAPIAIDREGTSLNINADTAAGEIAVALRAFKLINLTDVDGVMDSGRTQVYRRLSTGELERLIADGTVSGGMIPKITSSLNAVKHGVEQAHIINGNRGHNLLLELFTDAGVGTMISR